MPFSDETGGITIAFQELGYRQFVRSQIDRATLDIIKTQSVGLPAGQQGGARGRTNGPAGMAIGKQHPFSSKFVEIGRLNDRVTVASEVAVSKIIGKEHDDIRPLAGPRIFLGPARVRLQQYRAQKKQFTQYFHTQSS